MEKRSAVLEDRIHKAEKLREMGVELYPAGFHTNITVAEVIDRFEAMGEEGLSQVSEILSLAGRIMSRRDFGKASFIHIKDRTGRIQVYIRKDKIGSERFDVFKLRDIGDFIGIKGGPFKTKTGELTILAQDIRLLSKSLRREVNNAVVSHS